MSQIGKLILRENSKLIQQSAENPRMYWRFLTSNLRSLSAVQDNVPEKENTFRLSIDFYIVET